jgi:hypothetical protein
MNRVKFFVPAIVLCFYSCTADKVSVIIDNVAATESKVVIDDTMTIKPTASTGRYGSILLTEGSHSLSINGGEKKSFRVNGNGGVLNISGEEYVIFPLKFSNIKKEDEYGKTIKISWPIVIDSFWIREAGNGTDEKLMLQSLQNPAMKDMIGDDLKKTERSRLFIEKTWDYGLGEDIPTEIAVAVQNENTQTNEYKLKMTTTKAFLDYAIRSKQFDVIKIQDMEAVKRVVINGKSKK